MKKRTLLLIIISVLLLSSVYNPLKEVEGNFIVLSFSNVPMYGQKDFVLITAKAEKENKIFILEISPRWFLKEEFFNKIKLNSKIKVFGSLTKENWIVVRKISLGEIYSIDLRTKEGFPLWRVK